MELQIRFQVPFLEEEKNNNFFNLSLKGLMNLIASILSSASTVHPINLAMFKGGGKET